MWRLALGVVRRSNADKKQQTLSASGSNVLFTGDKEFPWSLSHEFARLFHCKPIVNGNRSCHGVIQETRCFGCEHF
jgi:hypothetical protein